MPQLERSASTSQTSTSTEYRCFGYYHPDADIANRHRHITLIIHTLLNHLCLLEHSSIHPIILMDPVFLLIAGMITMMILYLITIQCENNYIMHVFMNVFCEIYYICISFDILIPWPMHLYILFMLSVLCDMFWTCYTSILMSTICKLCRDFFKIF